MNRRNFFRKSALTGAGIIASQTMIGKLIDNKHQSGEISSISNTAKTGDFEKRKLGQHTVTALGLGCVDICPVGYYGCSTTKSDMIRLVQRAFDHGITLFDTAEVY